MTTYKENYTRWLTAEALTAREREELLALAADEKAMEDRFIAPLSFGTAGLRGIMGVGLNRMNVYVVRHATQAFAEVIREEAGDGASICICFDCRNNSALFAREAACVMAANGISVRLFAALRPTPELSFAVRRYHTTAGINVTASHNPKEYNGYKVYWSDGAQLPPPQADKVAEKMRTLDVFDSIKTTDYETAVAQGRITLLGEETDEAFLEAVMGQVINAKAVPAVADRFKMVYTPFHGTGWQLVPEALRRLGMKQLFCVEEQMIVDGNFPTVVSPNPENTEGFAMAIELAEKIGADFIVGTDPDADRMGIVARDRNGKLQVLSGNQVGVLLCDYILTARKAAGLLPERPVAIESIVSTKMVKAVTDAFGADCHETFTGFKFIAEEKDRLEAAGEGTVVFAFEESIGYMLGDYVRDKDAVTASVLVTEMAAWYADKGKTLIDALEGLYIKYGYYAEKTVNLVMPGLDGLSRMAEMMQSLRDVPPTDIAGTAVLSRTDYSDGTVTAADGTVSAIRLRDSNVLGYALADGTTFIVRPSGTEPKIKVYVLASGAEKETCEAKAEAYAAFAKTLPDIL